LTLILVVAAFAAIVAGTFAATYDESGALDTAASLSAARVAMVSLLFIVIAIVFGFLVYRRNMPMGVSTVLGVVAIVLIIVIGMNFHPIYLSNNTWMWIVGLYIAIASVTPVWILLQPRDYLSSFLLYAMIALAVIGVVLAHPSMDSMATAEWAVESSSGTTYLFPVLFTTIACGVISGFHSLISSGTTSKQLDKETDAKPIAYGGMLLECVLAILTLCAVAYAYSWNAANPRLRPVRRHRHLRRRHRPHDRRCHPRHLQRHLHPAGADLLRLLPDQSGHRRPYGPVHVPGVLAGLLRR
ncbi:MAG: hypothetical protein LUE61_01070, partial [Clostridiales bacterium]|nr:hypothetical protein [Clostridiales bacterium]